MSIKLFLLLLKLTCLEYETAEAYINLCLVFYKMIAKILSKRITRVIDGIISINQSAFIRNRLISVAHEILHYSKALV